MVCHFLIEHRPGWEAGERGRDGERERRSERERERETGRERDGERETGRERRRERKRETERESERERDGEREGERDGACINMRERCLAFMSKLNVLVLVVQGPPSGTCRDCRRQHSTAGCSGRKLWKKEEGLH